MLDAPFTRTNRTGQVNQVFILIVAVIVILATIALGAKLLGIFESTACDAADSGFRDELSRTLLGASEFGSRDIASVAIPCNAQTLFLIDAEAGQAATGEPTIDAALAAGVRANIFVIVDGTAQEVGYDQRIIVGRGLRDPLAAQRFLRIEERRGSFTFRTEGYGRAVRVDAQ